MVFFPSSPTSASSSVWPRQPAEGLSQTFDTNTLHLADQWQPRSHAASAPPQTAPSPNAFRASPLAAPARIEFTRFAAEPPTDAFEKTDPEPAQKPVKTPFLRQVQLWSGVALQLGVPLGLGAISDVVSWGIFGFITSALLPGIAFATGALGRSLLKPLQNVPLDPGAQDILDIALEKDLNKLLFSRDVQGSVFGKLNHLREQVITGLPLVPAFVKNNLLKANWLNFDRSQNRWLDMGLRYFDDSGSDVRVAWECAQTRNIFRLPGVWFATKFNGALSGGVEKFAEVVVSRLIPIKPLKKVAAPWIARAIRFMVPDLRTMWGNNAKKATTEPAKPAKQAEKTNPEQKPA
ncbi:MAG: hypothetical protein SFZ03_05825 [Candidatus Melainabacteria bacterium]|nr:hypothetical protein [Candidatus Melainabacteria bacterium]